MASNAPMWGLAGLSAMVLVAGLVISGGPMRGQAERRDADRRADLDAIHMQISCKTIESGVLTTDAHASPACPNVPRLTDPHSGAPYRVEVVDAHNIRLCAGFEAPPPGQFGFDAPDDQGCMVQRIETPEK
ncbi:MAG: hypothetical protein Q4G49_06240 [Paracoccus sp. (in: a-proteobacteria)]|nr:hypothetical protein [Paracoccus sp. (in: a-proteobacteria)]